MHYSVLRISFLFFWIIVFNPIAEDTVQHDSNLGHYLDSAQHSCSNQGCSNQD